MSPKFFQIGFNKCGTTFIEKLFRLNGIPAVHWLKGALAEDIAYSRLVGRPPLQPWARDHVAFTDMESVRHINMPVVEGFRDFAYLDQHFPGAVFLLNTRRVDDWINSRYLHQGGAYARNHALIRGVALADLGDLWRADWQAHIAACRYHFGDRREFIQIDIDHASPQDYRDALSPWFDLPQMPDLPGDQRKERRKGYQSRLADWLDTPQPGQDVGPDQRQAVAATLVQFSAPRVIRRDGPAGAEARHLFRFDAAAGVLQDGAGDALAIRRGADGRYLPDPRASVPPVIAAVANDIAEITRHGFYDLDMREACRLGSGARFATGGPVITQSRREGAENVFLWPMPRYHRLSNAAFLGPDPARWTPLSQRQDRAIWRGGLDGYARGQRGPHLGQTAAQAVALAQRDGGDAAAAMRGLNLITFLLARQDEPDLDLRLYPDRAGAQALRMAGLGKLITQGRPALDDLHSHRYVICMGGSPVQPDFLPALNAGAVVLKEEDGWQLYHSSLMRPWEHYIPLDYGAADLTEKLAWARANPDACQRMTARARLACSTLADPVGRRQQLTAILAAYRAATGQEG